MCHISRGKLYYWNKKQNDSFYQANVKYIDEKNVKLLVEEEEANVAVNSVDQ